MNEIQIIYKGSLFDSSGYGIAARNDIKAICSSGLNVIGESVSHTPDRIEDPFIQSLLKPINTKLPTIYITRQTPDLFTRYKGTIYNVGATIWETTKLPDNWNIFCNTMDEIWVATEWNKQIFKNCDITKDVYVFPHSIDITCMDNITINEEIRKQFKDTFIFFSIFQWIERKGYRDLLLAYFSEFTEKDNVVLVLKTFASHNTEEDMTYIKQQIEIIRKFTNLKRFPKLMVIHSTLSDNQIYSLMKTCDCYVLPVKSEGWGLTQMEAMLAGKPVISSNYGALLEFMTPYNSFLINCIEEPVYGMPSFMKYDSKQTWGQPSISHLAKLMRLVYEHREEANKIGLLGQKDIKEHFSFETIGKKFKQRIEQIIEKEF